jgi:hypothetical protein
MCIGNTGKSTLCNNLRTESASIPDSITEVVNAVTGDEPIHFRPVWSLLVRMLNDERYHLEHLSGPILLFQK